MRSRPARVQKPSLGREAARELSTSFGFAEVDPSVKADLVKGVFDRVAGRYDLMNDLMSGGIHRLWKDSVVDWLMPRAGRHYLDVAGGTGDMASRIERRIEGASRITVIDINATMLATGRDRSLDEGTLSDVDWIAGDAMMLPLPDRSIDAYTIAFGLRNVTRIDEALAEARRVLRPGGRFLCLEFSRLLVPMLQPLYDLYSERVVPLVGLVVAGDAASYRYLVESIRRFPDQKTLSSLIAEVGFGQVRCRNLSGGIAAIHSAWRL